MKALTQAVGDEDLGLFLFFGFLCTLHAVHRLPSDRQLLLFKLLRLWAVRLWPSVGLHGRHQQFGTLHLILQLFHSWH